MHYVPRALIPPKTSFFLLGARGTGKSTWLGRNYPTASRIDLLLPEEERKYLAHPERIREVVDGSSGIVIIDEVQRAPGILPVIHSLIEEGSPVQFILTGSSARKLRKEIGNLLGGRLLMRHMAPFLASELGPQFSLQKALKVGLIPMIWQSPDSEERVRNYVGVYLKEEVQAEGLVRQVGNFARFMETASFSHGQLWNSTDIARECQVKRTTVDNYLHILEDLLLAFILPVFTRRAQRTLISHPKFYYFDTGVFRSLRPQGPMDKEAEIEGPSLEGLVAGHLRTWVLSQKQAHQFAFWRTRTHLEVDFVIYGPQGFWAIEVKRSMNLTPDDVKGLHAFKEEYPEATCLLLFNGQQKILYKGVLCIPIAEFLLNLKIDAPLLPSDAQTTSE
jgi:predicted AAA+ superfamily ATPase